MVPQWSKLNLKLKILQSKICQMFRTAFCATIIDYTNRAKLYIAKLYMCANNYIMWTGSSGNTVASKRKSHATQQSILQPPKSEPSPSPRSQPTKTLQPITQPWKTQSLKPQNPEANPSKSQQPTTKPWKRQPRETQLPKTRQLPPQTPKKNSNALDVIGSLIGRFLGG